MFEFLKGHTARIEVCVDDNLQRVYFPIKPVCRYISYKKQKELMLRVRRESQQTKVVDLMKACPELMDEMEMNESLYNAKYIQITPNLLLNLKDFSSYMSMLISTL